MFKITYLLLYHAYDLVKLFSEVIASIYTTIWQFSSYSYKRFSIQIVAILKSEVSAIRSKSRHHQPHLWKTIMKFYKRVCICKWSSFTQHAIPCITLCYLSVEKKYNFPSKLLLFLFSSTHFFLFIKKYIFYRY